MLWKAERALSETVRRLRTIAQANRICSEEGDASFFNVIASSEEIVPGFTRKSPFKNVTRRVPGLACGVALALARFHVS